MTHPDDDYDYGFGYEPDDQDLDDYYRSYPSRLTPSTPPIPGTPEIESLLAEALIDLGHQIERFGLQPDTLQPWQRQVARTILYEISHAAYMAISQLLAADKPDEVKATTVDVADVADVPF